MADYPATFDELVDRVRGHADEIERAARIPPPLASDLRAAGLFTLLLPRMLGGPQMEFPAYVHLVQAFAEADGSVAWCINQASVLATLSLQLPGEVAREIWQSPRTTLANGPPAGCEATPCENGYRLTGTWTFSSGITHADWLVGVATLTTTDGERRALWSFFPKEAADVTESWAVSGLKGTASYSFSVETLFVPFDHATTLRRDPTADRLYQVPMNLLFACGFAAVALGVSRAAIDFAIARTRTKTKRFSKNTMAQDLAVQGELGVAEAEWSAVNALLHNAVGRAWDSLTKTPVLDVDGKIRLRMAATHTIRACKSVTDRVYDLCSTDSIFHGSDIQRRFQDIHVISQHLQGRPEIYRMVGSHLVGLPFDTTMIS
jgi:alkylation response protein AidB-like acyl-CoA dehydrogenase